MTHGRVSIFGLNLRGIIFSKHSHARSNLNLNISLLTMCTTQRRAISLYYSFITLIREKIYLLSYFKPSPLAPPSRLTQTKKDPARRSYAGINFLMKFIYFLRNEITREPKAFLFTARAEIKLQKKKGRKEILKSLSHQNIRNFKEFLELPREVKPTEILHPARPFFFNN